MVTSQRVLMSELFDPIQLNIEEIFTMENMNFALDMIKSKNKVKDINGITPEEFTQYWKMNRESILETVYVGTYRPGIVHEVEIIQPNGKRRQIVLMSTLDRFLLQCVLCKIQPLCEKRFHPYSHAFQTGKGVMTAVRQASTYIREGRVWIGELDIHSFYDTIPIQKLENELVNWFSDKSLLCLLTAFLHPKVERDLELEEKQIGILQGSPISPLLSNIYLHSFDLLLAGKNIEFVRYCDDLNIFTRSYDDALNKLNFARKQLAANYSLSVNPGKTGVFQAFNRSFLGYVFTKDAQSGQIYSHKHKKDSLAVYSRWNKSAIQKVDRNYHLVNDGILTKKDFNILFENEEGKYYIPVETTDSLNIYSNITISGDFLRYAGEKGLSINVFDKYGNLSGRFVSGTEHYSMKILLRQAVCYNDPAVRLRISKTIITAASHNMRSNVLAYKRRKDNESIFTEKDKILKEIIAEMNEADSVEALMMMEARARQHYYSVFPVILENTDFTFEKRTKRPPRDAVNAMISFGNTILYNRLASEINKSALDIRISYLHSANNRKQSLNLDLAEIFKPIIVDRVVFSLVNRRMLDVREHFEVQKDGGVLMTSEGKKIFIGELEGKLYSKLKVDGEILTYDSLMRREVVHFRQYMDEKGLYKAFRYY